jgi:hypothetical protein
MPQGRDLCHVVLPMKVLCLSVAMMAGTVGLGAGQTSGARPSAAAERSLMGEYCVGCHNDRVKRGDLVLSHLDETRADADAPIWEKVIRKVRAGMMPPANARRPDAARVEAFVTALETSLDKSAAATPNPGPSALHRMNRTEYANSIRDLLGFDVDVASLLPPDDMSHGFDNIAESLTISPTLMESYIKAADAIARMAAGDRTTSPRVETYRVPQTFTQKDHVEGTPLGTRGGVAVRHFFPADGEYTFGMSFYHYNGKIFGSLQEREQLEVSVDGLRVALLDVNLKMPATDELRTPAVKVGAGQRLVSAAFIKRAEGPVQDFVMPSETALNNLAAEVPGVTGLLHLTTLGISGPRNVTGPGDTPSRRKIFICRPANAGEEEPCARRILATLARPAFRRPVKPADVDHLMALFRDARTHRATSTPASGWASRASWRIQNSSFDSSTRRPMRHPDRSRGSAISNWPPVSHTFCGAAVPMKRSSTWRVEDSWRIPRRSSSRYGGCSRTPGPTPWRRTSPRSGCTCVTCATGTRIPTPFPTAIEI